MLEEGTITRTTDRNAWVRIGRSTMCDHCGSKSACKTLGGGRVMEAEVRNTAGGKVGDRVLLKIDTSSFLKITFLVYIIPIIALIAGALIGMKLAPEYSLNPELSSILFGVIAFVLSFLFIHRFGKYAKKRQKYMPAIVKILSSGCTA
jgi:sigma-E factor negative regulatory protein RseC